MYRTVALIFLVANGALAAESTYEVALKARSCHTSSFDKNQLNCMYKIGKSLVLEIAGVGDREASVNFIKSDADGDYWAAFGMAHHCVMVKQKTAVPPSMAFISPKDGKVYESPEGCSGAK